MKNVYSTKNALISSVVLLALCFSMLVGTTFAWFTDSAASSGNIIETGNLNVEMYWADGTKAIPADDSADWKNASEGAIFTHTLWEPNYAEVRHIKIANEGSLALKYKVNIIANGEVSELSDVIDVYYVDPAVQVSSANALVDDYYIGTLTEVLANLGETGSGALEAGKDDTITIALRMNKDAGNKYQGLSIGTSFSIQLLATQFTSEKDAFGDQYDKDAEYAAIVNNASELASAIKLGGNVILNSDIALADGEKVVIAEGKVAAIDLNGKSITGGLQQGSTTKHVYVIENRGQLTLDGDGVVSGRGIANHGTLTINGGTYNAVDTNGGGCVWGYAGSSLTINDGTFITADNTVAPAATCLNVAAGSEALINGGTFISNANQTAGIINNGTLTINNINIVSDHNVIGSTAGNVTINGGSFELVGVANQTSNMIYTTSGLVTINGGNFIYDKNDVLDSGHLLTFAGGEVVINGGNFEGYVTTQLDNYGYSSGKATVYGGTFDQDPTRYVAAGYIVSETTGKFVVTKDVNVGPTVNVVVNTAAELQAALTPSVSDGKAVIEIGSDIELAAGETWTPLNMDPYLNVNQIIINGNGHTIKGLNAPLIGDVHFGGTQVTISGLTLANCQILDQCYNSGLGAFISYADRSDLIILDNCHLKDSTVRASAGTGVGGLIGYSSSTLVIDGCSVTNCTISGASQSAGAIAGHVSAHGTNTTTMTDVKVVGCNVTGERTDKTGYVIGTANIGATTITTVDCSANTVFGVANSTKIYGRYKGSATSSLVVNGESMPQD